MDIIPDKRKVVGLVEQAHAGKICLPNFQRDFIWTREEVADLVRSILRGYFIGSLLLLRSDPQQPPFAPIFLRGAKPLHAQPTPDLLVLDGQQRLSSLVYALTAPDLSLKDSTQRRWFFVSLDVLLSEPDSDAVVFDRARRELRGLEEAEVQYEQRILPCTSLLSMDRFLTWRDGFEDWMRTNSAHHETQYREQWRGAWTAAATAFQSFEVPLVELPQVDESDAGSIGRVCAIFEKLNSTGVDLSVYDLLTARLYRSEIKLHDLWAEACKKHGRLRAWSDGKADQNKFGVLVLRTLALLRGLDPKPRILIDLKPEGFENDWRRAAAAMDRALELVTHVGDDGFGVFADKWLPGFGLLPVVAALRAEIDERKLGAAERVDLRRWYWCNVFLERYSSAVESKSRKDYLEMTKHWFEGGPEPDVFSEARNLIGSPGYRVRGSASFASAVYSGVFCLLALRKAQDWRRRENIQLQQLQDHHIFPQAFLKRHGVERRPDVNTIANRTLISDETNGRIKDAAPAAYLGDADIFPHGPDSSLLNAHFIGPESVALMQEAKEPLSSDAAHALYERFVQQREAAIVREIRRVCGVSDPSSTEPAELAPDEPAADIVEGRGDADEEVDEPTQTAPNDEQHGGASMAPAALGLAPGELPMPAGAAWLTPLESTAAFDHRWPAQGGHFDETYPKAWRGRVRIGDTEHSVLVGECQRYDRGRLSVFLDRYPLAEFMDTADGAGWASLIKPDGRKTAVPGQGLPALYRDARVVSYREVTGVSGSGHPTGLALVIARDDLRSAVHHAVARQLGKLGRPLTIQPA